MDLSRPSSLPEDKIEGLPPGVAPFARSQAEHHRKRSFEEEFIAFLKKHGVEYDPKHVWG